MKERIRAVDVVVVPPKEIREFCIDLSQKLVGSAVILGEEDFVPHITLNMGHTTDVEMVKDQVGYVVKSEYPLKIEVDKLLSEKGTNLILRRTPSLLRLHFRMLGEVALSSHGRLKEAYWEGDARQRTLDYLSIFRSAYSRHNFVPHITIGNGQLPEGLKVDLPGDFEADTVALFHLGNHNTCRELLGSWQLGE